MIKVTQSKKDKQLKAWYGLIACLKVTGNLDTYAAAKHLRSLIGMPLALDFSLFYQEEMAQLHGYILSASRNVVGLQSVSGQLATAILGQAKAFDELTVSKYREAVMILWCSRMELSHSKCSIGTLPYSMHWYEDNYHDLCRLHLNNQYHNFRVRYDIEEGNKNATV